MKKSILIALALLITINCFSQAPNWAWAKEGQGTGNDLSNSTATDAQGNVYITGRFNNATITFGSKVLTNAGGNDIFVVKYDSVGNVLWAKQAGGSNSEVANGISIDLNGNAYIIGTFYSNVITFGTITIASTPGSHIFIAKYDPLGNILWVRTPIGNSDEGAAIANDASGNVYITGSVGYPYTVLGNDTLYSTDTSTGIIGDVFVAKYDSLGNEIWARKGNGVGGTSYHETGYAIKTGSNGNVYVTGHFNGPSLTFGSTTLTNVSSGKYDIFIVEYDKFGNFVLAKSAGGTDNDYSRGITTDSGGNIYITGDFSSPTITFGINTLNITSTGGFSDIFIVSYRPSGNLAWATSAGGMFTDEGMGIEIDAANNVYVTGRYVDSISFGSLFPNSYLINSNGTGTAVYVVKYDSYGYLMWAKTVGGSKHDFGIGLAMDLNGNIFVTGGYSSFSIIFGKDTLTNTFGRRVFTSKLNQCAISPPEISSNNSTSFCIGDSVLLTSSSATDNLWNTGSTSQSITVKSSGTYSVRYTNYSTGCSALSLPTTVEVVPLPSVNINSPSICIGQPAILIADGATSYVWSAGATAIGTDSATASPISTTTYTVVGTNLCGSDSSISTVTVNPTYNKNDSASICQGYIYTFPDGTIDSISTVHMSHLSTINSCDSIIVTTLIVNQLPIVTINLSSVDTLCQSVGVVNLTGENPIGGLYSGNGVIGNSFNANTAGLGSQSITYIYTDGNTCANTATGNIYVHLCTGISEGKEDNLLSIFPNPTSGQFSIGPSTDNAEILVTDILGQQVIKTQVTRKTTIMKLDNNGVYIVYVKTKKGTTMQKLIVDH